MLQERLSDFGTRVDEKNLCRLNLRLQTLEGGWGAVEKPEPARTLLLNRQVHSDALMWRDLVPNVAEQRQMIKCLSWKGVNHTPAASAKTRSLH
jgi:hypothetical protein